MIQHRSLVEKKNDLTLNNSLKYILLHESMNAKTSYITTNIICISTQILSLNTGSELHIFLKSRVQSKKQAL